LPATVLLLGISTTAAHAADKVRIMVGGLEKILYLPAKLADQLGYYKDEGLDVELINVAAGSVSETALLSGTAEAAVGAYEQTIHIQAKGKYVTEIAQISACPQEALLVSTKANVKTPADLKGATIGVTGFGSFTHFLTMDILARAGLKPSDASYLAVGAGNTFITAMEQDRTQAGMTQEPTVSILIERKDAHILVDMRTAADTQKALGGDYPGSSIYVRNDWIQSHKDTAAKLSQAFQRALQYMASHSAEEIADKMPASYYNGNKALYVASLKTSLPGFTKDGRMPEDGPKTVIEVLNKFSKDIQGKNIDLSKTYTNEFIK
jgi:NitT/TauT family transport system substrate-binding protein